MKKTKPQPKSRTGIDYNEAENWVGKKLGYKLRDAAGHLPHYGKWCRAHGERPLSNSQEQFKRYMKAPDGDKACPPYRDYWHFLVDSLQPSRGGSITIGSDLLGAEPWQDEITKAFIEEFGDNKRFFTDW